MPRYLNKSGNSGISSYEMGDGWISVTFTSGRRYVYTDSSVGSAADIRKMQALAREGRGLSAFIAKTPNVRNGYERGAFTPRASSPSSSSTRVGGGSGSARQPPRQSASLPFPPSKREKREDTLIDWLLKGVVLLLLITVFIFGFLVKLRSARKDDLSARISSKLKPKPEIKKETVASSPKPPQPARQDVAEKSEWEECVACARQAAKTSEDIAGETIYVDEGIDPGAEWELADKLIDAAQDAFDAAIGAFGMLDEEIPYDDRREIESALRSARTATNSSRRREAAREAALIATHVAKESAVKLERSHRG